VINRTKVMVSLQATKNAFYISYTVIDNPDLIVETTTITGLTVSANLDDTVYPTGIKISDKQIKMWNIERYSFHGEWNYIFRPYLVP
jgi:hypothetical protein